MGGTSFGGAAGVPEECTILPKPVDDGTYVAGQILNWDASNDYYDLSTTRSNNAVVVAESKTIATAGDLLNVIVHGFARVKFDATCEYSDLVVSSDATAGNAEKYVRANLNATFSDTEVEAALDLQANIFAKVMEVVDGTTNYYMIYIF